MTTGFWQRLLRGARRLDDTLRWQSALGPHWADTIMGVCTDDDFHAKQGRSTARWVIAEGLSVYLKRHYRLAWWRGLLALVAPGCNWSPAFQELTNLRWALSAGLPVPQPVAAAEFIGPGWRLQSVLAVGELTGMLPLHQAIPLARARLAPQVFLQWKRVLLAELAHLAAELHRRRRYHKDLYLCHFYLPRALIDGWRPDPVASFRGQLYMIDLHRLAHHRWTWPYWQLKDLAQLLYSSDVDGVTERDRAEFWRLYRGRSARSGWTRWLEWAIRLKWLRYRGHNRKRDRKNLQITKRAA
jgi:heptose I phosphotransferase